MANRMVETWEDGTGLPTGRLLDIRSERTLFEAQGFTDEVNTEYRHAPEDEAVVVPPRRLEPGESHVQTTAYRFRVEAPAGHAQLV